MPNYVFGTDNSDILDALEHFHVLRKWMDTQRG